MANILIADDNPNICMILEDFVKKEGFKVQTAFDGEEALALFQANSFDLILLDIMMPKRDGLSVCKEIRKTSTVPIIMVTAKGEDYDKIMGLDIGADDYIVKPFSPAVLMARVRAILRRLDRLETEKSNENLFRFENLLIDFNTYIAMVDKVDLRLTKKELELLWTLATNHNRVFTRDQLLDTIWGYDYFGDTRTVDSHIKRLRAKIDDYTHPNWEIGTIWGVGYQFKVKSNEA